MANLTITTCSLVKGDDEHQATYPAGEAISAGQYIRPNATTGKFELGNATTAAEVGDGYIALHAAAIGEPVTGVKSPAILDVGEALAAMNFGAAVYLSDTDGTLADAAGTVSTAAGRVVAGWANTSADKLLRVTLS